MMKDNILLLRHKPTEFSFLFIFHKEEMKCDICKWSARQAVYGPGVSLLHAKRPLWMQKQTLLRAIGAEIVALHQDD